jgi:hypothetical protein
VVLSCSGSAFVPIHSSARTPSSWATRSLTFSRAFDIADVDVEYRESVYKWSVGPALLRSISNLSTTVDIRGPLTPALGLPIAASDRPGARGTLALLGKITGETENDAVMEYPYPAIGDIGISAACHSILRFKLSGSQFVFCVPKQRRADTTLPFVSAGLYSSSAEAHSAHSPKKTRQKNCPSHSLSSSSHPHPSSVFPRTLAHL